ncbi:oligoendopeptidase, M3 family [Clostridiales bacterium KA00134]|nr:oligoendopeptidase, M3 family [Clostridiales bacterium KA00134]
MKFNDMPYVRPNLDEVKATYKDFIKKINEAKSADETIKTIKNFSVFSKDLNTMAGLSEVRNSINSNDEFYDKEKDFFNEARPIFGNLYSEFAKAVLNSKFKEDIRKQIGDHYLKLLDCSLVLKEDAIPFMQKENALISKYQNLLANSKIEFEKKTYTLTQMAPLLQDVDRERRKAAYDAKWAWFEKNEAELDSIYEEMVKTRDQMAKALGYKDYIDFRYKELCRTDYDRDDSALYRKKILKNISPLAMKLRKDQAKDIGLGDDFKFYDRPVEFKDGNPIPQGDKDFIVSNAKLMYRELSKETGEFFDFMVNNDLMDLVAAPGKRGGGYCTSFDKYKSPFIFSNFNGTKGDIDVITHEAGHAFQNYMSQYQEIEEYIWPTYEACEIHSMSMEFLTWPWMEKFFDDADKFRYSALKDAICFLPYGVTVDHFQEWVYENPNASPAERKAKYKELELTYQPDLNYDNDFLNKGTYWFGQMHIFTSPLYYIDYTLAQVCAFQYLLKYLQDKDKTLQEYITLCKAGGSKAFFDLIEIGKIKNPMTSDVIKEMKPKLENLLADLKTKIK